MLRQCLIVVCCVIQLGVINAAQRENWLERFLSERRLAFGKVSEHSLKETERFLFFPKPIECPVAPPTAVLLVTTPVPKPAGKKEPPTAKPKINVVPLLKRAEAAFQEGRLEEARRLYRLVLKSDPSTPGVTEKLTEIAAQLKGD